MKRFIGIYLIAAMMVVTLAGCAALQNFFSNNEMILKASVELAVAIELDKHPDWREPMIKVSSRAIDAVDKGVILDLASAGFYIKQSIRIDELEPLTRVAVSNMIDGLMAAIMQTLVEKKIDLPGAELVEVRKVLGWVYDFARLAPSEQKALLKKEGK